jgi:hypothetical protein
VNFFTPCLLFSKVAFSLSAGMGMLSLIPPARHLSLIDEFWDLWIIPLFFILISGVSLVVAWLLAVVFRLDRRQKYVLFPTFPHFVVEHFFKEIRYGCCHDHELEFPPSRTSPIACCFIARD